MRFKFILDSVCHDLPRRFSCVVKKKKKLSISYSEQKKGPSHFLGTRLIEVVEISVTEDEEWQSDYCV